MDSRGRCARRSSPANRARAGPGCLRRGPGRGRRQLRRAGSRHGGRSGTEHGDDRARRHPGAPSRHAVRVPGPGRRPGRPPRRPGPVHPRRHGRVPRSPHHREPDPRAGGGDRMARPRADGRGGGPRPRGDRRGGRDRRSPLAGAARLPASDGRARSRGRDAPGSRDRHAGRRAPDRPGPGRGRHGPPGRLRPAAPAAARPRRLAGQAERQRETRSPGRPPARWSSSSGDGATCTTPSRAAKRGPISP